MTPHELSFVIDLNGYGNPWNFGAIDTTRLRYFQEAQWHRQSMNTLPYGWGGNVTSGRAPTLTGSGATRAAADWTEFDRQYGPMFDGSAFTPATAGSPYHGPGQATPVATFYTTIFESWPTPVLDPVHGFDADGQGGAYWGNLIDSELYGWVVDFVHLWVRIGDRTVSWPDVNVADASISVGAVLLILNEFRVHSREPEHASDSD